MTLLVELHCGNVLDVLRGMQSESVQCVVTSPPYYGLRNYNTPPVIWDDPGDCQHEWGEARTVRQTPQRDHASDGSFGNTRGTEASRVGMAFTATTGQFCQKCGAWVGHLGLEPDPFMYIRHLVEIFREVRRVLRKDGTCWIWNNRRGLCSTGAQLYWH